MSSYLDSLALPIVLPIVFFLLPFPSLPFNRLQHMCAHTKPGFTSWAEEQNLKKLKKLKNQKESTATGDQGGGRKEACKGGHGEFQPTTSYYGSDLWNWLCFGEVRLSSFNP